MSHARIFIVEDEALIAMELEDRLEHLGYEVCGHAARGREALTQIPEARPDLLLMDINLGSEPSGLVVAEKVREQSTVPIIFLTAYSDSELVERAARCPAAMFMTKPFSPEVLHANIQMALATHAVEERLRDANRRIDETAAALRQRTIELEKRNEVQRQLEAQLRQSQKMEAIGTLAGGIAHDFNNLLTVIVGNLELALTKISSSHPVMPHLAAVSTAAERAGELVHQILAFSRKQPQKRVPTELGPLVLEAAKLLRATIPAGTELSVTVDPDAPCVLADASQLQQVLMNLGTNAWHALAGPGGRVGIHLLGTELDAAPAAALGLAPGRYAQLQVSDTGQGMDAKTLERIFEPFFTTKGPQKGSGLGLSVVHGIVREHAGIIHVESRPGVGSTFRVYVPATSQQPSGRDETQGAPSFAKYSERVLLLDDEAAVVTVAKKLLERLGCTVFDYLHPADALDAVRREPERFTVVFTDFNMPSMSGLDVAREVRRLAPATPVVLVSGFEERTDQDLRSSGVSHRLQKPFGLKDLSEVLSAIRDREDAGIEPSRETAEPPNGQELSSGATAPTTVGR